MMGSAALLCVVSLLEAVDGTLDDTSIRTAVRDWIFDRSAAEATYGHISTWETGGVTDMSYLFCYTVAIAGAMDCWRIFSAPFNDDIGAWDTSGVTSMASMFEGESGFNQDIGDWSVDSVTDMNEMFFGAYAFNQDIGGWAVDKVTDMTYMFLSATAFDQDLGWCVADGVSLGAAFSGTRCASTSCGVLQGVCVMTDSKIRTAVAAWLSDATAAEATYGHISMWATGGVTDMQSLFYSASAFNEDIGGWDTSGVTSMIGMFNGASVFNQDLSGWAVHNVIDMRCIFCSAWAFDQDLGWCVDDDVDLGSGLSGAFRYAPCESTSCGVIQGTCAPTPAPTTTRAPTPGPARSSSSSGSGAIALIAGAAAVAAALLLAVGALCLYRRHKASTMDKADEPSRTNLEPTELPPLDEATLPNEEEATISVAPEAEEASTEQPPPPPARRTEPEPAAKAEEMYNQIAAWYNEPETAALRATWGAYPEPEDFQTWPGFVAVTNAFLDREAG